MKTTALAAVLCLICAIPARSAPNPDEACNTEAIRGAMSKQVARWVTSAFYRFAGTEPPAKAQSTIVYAWRTQGNFACRAIAITGFGTDKDVFADDSNRAILTVVNFTVSYAKNGKRYLYLRDGIAPRDITMGEAFASAELMLNELQQEGHVLPTFKPPS